MTFKISLIVVITLGIITLVAGLILYEFIGFDSGEYVTTVGILLTAVAGFITVLVKLFQPTTTGGNNDEKRRDETELAP